jgi:radical SAM superfamily enzyme YgiQ (UPF0313 family)
MASLYLKSFVNKHAPQTKVALGDDNYNLDSQAWIAPYDAIGISIMTPQRDEAYRIARHIKQHFPKKIVIAGGPHVKHYKQEVYANFDFDYVVPLDGERPLAKILNGTANSRLLVDVMSREDIASAPRPDRTSEEARNLISRYNYNLGGRTSTTMMSSRGCPMTCTFCEDARTTAKWSSLDNLKGEMDDIVNLGFKGVYLFDDLFAIAMDKVRPIAEELKKRDLIYRCNGQANFFTKWGEEFAKLLSDTGCYEIAFGHESGSQKILDNITKRTLVEQNYRSVEYARKYGIKVKSFLMLGLPGEDEETVKATEAFIRDAQPDDFQLCVYYPYKGTQIRDAIDRGDNTMDIHFEGEGLGAYGQKGGSTESVVRTSRYTSKELMQIRDELVRKYKPESHTNKWKGDKFFQTHEDGK